MKTSARQSQKYVQCSNTAEYNELQNKQTIKGRLVKDRLPLYLCKDNGDE